MPSRDDIAAGAPWSGPWPPVAMVRNTAHRGIQVSARSIPATRCATWCAFVCKPCITAPRWKQSAQCAGCAEEAWWDPSAALAQATGVRHGGTSVGAAYSMVGVTRLHSPLPFALHGVVWFAWAGAAAQQRGVVALVAKTPPGKIDASVNFHATTTPKAIFKRVFEGLPVIFRRRLLRGGFRVRREVEVSLSAGGSHLGFGPAVREVQHPQPIPDTDKNIFDACSTE